MWFFLPAQDKNESSHQPQQNNIFKQSSRVVYDSDFRFGGRKRMNRKSEPILPDPASFYVQNTNP